MPGPSLFEELKRRRVYRAAAAYVIAAFALLQAADIVLPALGAPPVVLRIIVVFAIAGLPVAVSLAWLFDLTTSGLKRAPPASSGSRAGGDVPPPIRGRTAVLGIAGVVIAALLVGGAGWVAVRGFGGLGSFGGLSGERHAAGAAPAGATGTAANRAAANGGADGTGADGGENGAASVAVLPCSDVSATRENEYFGDGITEEIIGELARFQRLKVISRTSVVALRGTPLTVPQIADTLRVRHVVQCSVQRAGNRVRVWATLIDPRTDTNVWSESFDRELADVISVQQDIARSIGTALLMRLPDPTQRPAPTRQPMPAAYDAYLRGTTARRQLSPQGLRAALAAFEEAIAADPTFAPAYAGLAEAHVLWTTFGYPGREPDPYQRVALALAHAERAIELDPLLAEAYATRAHAGMRAWLPSDAVLADLDRAAQLAPNAAEIRLLRGVGLAFAGRFEEAIREAELAVSLDPLAPSNHDLRAMALVLGRRYDDALRAARTARALVPEFPNPIRQELRALLLLGRAEECAALDSGPYAGLRAMCLHSAGRRAEAAAVIDSLKALVDDAPSRLVMNIGGVTGDIAEYHAWIGDPTGVRLWLRRSVEFSPHMQFLVHHTATYDAVRNDRAYQAELETLQLAIRRRITGQ